VRVRHRPVVSLSDLQGIGVCEDPRKKAIRGRDRFGQGPFSDEDPVQVLDQNRFPYEYILILVCHLKPRDRLTVFVTD
jgi:hypothetical protein